MPNYYIKRAIESRIKETRGAFNPEESRDTFAQALYDLEYSVRYWPHHVIPLLDVSNWNLPRLMKEGSLRKPKVYLLLEHTSKENLVIDWYPGEPAHNYLHETDFLHWSNYWHPNKMPDNRILIIHKAEYLFPYGKPATDSVKYLLKGLHEHIKEIVHILGRLVEVKLLSDMYLEYGINSVIKGKKPITISEDQLVNCRVLAIDEISKIEDKKWLKAKFEQIGISQDRFLKMFWEADGKYRRFAKTLRDKGVKGVGEATAERIVEGTRTHFPDIYSKHLPMKFRTDNIDGKVIQLFKKNENSVK